MDWLLLMFIAGNTNGKICSTHKRLFAFCKRKKFKEGKRRLVKKSFSIPLTDDEKKKKKQQTT